MEKVLEKIENYILLATIFLVPLAFAPISPNPYLVIKLTILVFGFLLVLFLKALRVIIGGKLELSVGNFDLAVLVLAIAYILSTILRTQNKMEALLLPGTAAIVVSSALAYFLINQLGSKEKGLLSQILVYSGAVYSIIILLAGFGIFAKIPQLPDFIKIKNFTPSGGYLPGAIMFAAILPFGAGLAISEKSKKIKAALFVSLALIAAGLGFTVFNMLPGKPFSPRLPNFTTSWFIAIDTIKNSPLFGVGPGSYLTAFNRFRPVSYNTTDLWALKFTTANNQYITIMTETGLLGTFGLILLLLAIYKHVKKDLKEKKLVGWGFAGNSNLISLGVITLSMFFFPATITPFLLFFIFLSLNAQLNKSSINLTSQVTTKEGSSGFKGIASRLPAILVTIPVYVVVILVFLNAQKYVRAEYKYRKSLAALARNEGIVAYNAIREAININPFVDRYHASYSQINLALANALAGKEEISEQDRNNIAQLVQQAIREGKATVALNPLRSGNWEVLAATYQSIIPLAKGADVFTVQTLAQAIALDPLNPNLRIRLGGLHYAAGNFETAIKVFELAVAAKPDLANARYNLAFALKDAGKLDEAISQMSVVLSLVEPNTKDYEAAKQALEDMQAQKEVSQKESENLAPPQEAPEPIITPPLELPEEAQPPEAPITPTPTPEPEEEGEEPTITPQVTPTPTLIP